MNHTDATQPWIPAPLPPAADLESRAILKKAAEAHRALAELKGVVGTLPNQHILLSTLPLQEAKDSCAIENIVITHDELYRAALQDGPELLGLNLTKPSLERLYRGACSKLLSL